MDKMSDELNAELSIVTMESPNPQYDWKVVTLLSQSVACSGEYLDKTLAKSAEQSDGNARVAFKKLHSRISLTLQRVQELLVERSKPAPQNTLSEYSAQAQKIAALEQELAAKNKAVLDLEKKLAEGLKTEPPIATAATVAPQVEVDKLLSLAERIDSLNALYKEEGAPTESTELSTLVAEGHEMLAATLKRYNEQDDSVKTALDSLQRGLTASTTMMRETMEKMNASATLTANELQSASQKEIDKLRKRVSQIETDLEAKDKTLLEQETQLLKLTDDVEVHQKREDELRKQLQARGDDELAFEEKKQELLAKIKAKDDDLVQLESLKSQADDEILKLQDLLSEADNQLRQVEIRIGPLEQENQALQQRFTQNEQLVTSVKQDFQ